jgi:selenophosphate synthetase-related protein
MASDYRVKIAMAEPTLDADDELDELDKHVALVRSHPGLRSKASIGMVRDVFGTGDWLTGPGDDAALVGAGDGRVVVCGEALYPPFAQSDPHGAGVAAVLTNVNDVAAMGGEPLGIVDTLVGGEDPCRLALEGMREASRLYQVPIVGGHLTVSEGPLAISAFAVGRCRTALSATAARPGQRLGLLACLEGDMRADFPFFRSFEPRGERLGGDVRLLARLADQEACVAAKDVSMAGLIGSLAMLLEPNRCGVTVDLDTLPRPDGVPLDRWLISFPCYAFLVCVPDEAAERRCREAAEERELSYSNLGTLDATGRIDLALGGARRTAFDLTTEAITGLAPTDSRK